MTNTGGRGKFKKEVVMEYFEKISNSDKYCYFVAANEPSIPGHVHEIACFPHLHNSIEFLFITKGVQTATVLGKQYELTAGEILFVNKYESHFYDNCEGVEGYILVLSPRYFEMFQTLRGGKIFPRLMQDKDKNKAVFEFVAEWKKEYKKDRYDENFYDIFVMSNNLFRMLKDRYALEENALTENDKTISKILQYVEDKYREEITLKEVAKHIGYTTEYCSKIFSMYMKENFRTYLNRVRVMKFNELIKEDKNKDKTILTVAFECGFCSQATFYRAYSNVFGTLPKEHKK